MRLSTWLDRKQMTKAEFGRRLGEALVELGVTNIYMPVPSATVSRWTLGRRLPSPSMMTAIRYVCCDEVSPNDFHPVSPKVSSPTSDIRPPSSDQEAA